MLAETETLWTILFDKEKKDEKDGLISIDESRDNQSEIQKITDKFIALIETKLSDKEKEILKVWNVLTS